MSSFWKSFFACILAWIVICAFSFLSFIGLIAAIATNISGETVLLKSSTVLEIDLSNPIKDRTIEEPLTEFMYLIEGDNVTEIQLSELLKVIEKAKYDDNIIGISLKGAGFGGGLAQLESIKKALNDFKTSDKFILSYADNYSQSSLFAKSNSHKIYMNPNGIVDLKGFSVSNLFFKDFFEKYGIGVQIFRVGKYKSAVEPFMQNKMSEENKVQYLDFMTSVWDTLTKSFAQNRNLSKENIDYFSSNLIGYNAKKCVDFKIVDSLVYLQEYDSILKHSYKAENKISYKKYLSLIDQTSVVKQDKIALLYAQGEISFSSDSPDVISEKSFAKSISKIKKDKNIKAVVLRIDSPGGSATVSDNIWYMLKELKKDKKVVVSMGNYAASGGYYIACPADYIFAEPTTLTGSIGIFGVLPNVQKLVNQNGIKVDGVSLFKNSEYNFFSPAGEIEKNRLQQTIEKGYDLFVSRVAEGRKMSFADVNDIAQGRIWSGKQALKIGLVDELGGLDRAINKAAEMSEIQLFSLEEFPEKSSSLDRLLQISSKDDSDVILDAVFGKNENVKALKEIRKYILQEQKGSFIYARVPFECYFDFK